MAPDEDENNYSEINFPLKKRGKGDLNFLLFRHCEERSDVRILSDTADVILRLRILKP
jgi:hypothetical protein